MGMRQNYLFPWGGEIPCSENIEPCCFQIFDNKYFVYEQFRMLYRFSGPSDCWKIPFPRFLPTRNFPVRRNFSGFMDFASKYWGANGRTFSGLRIVRVSGGRLLNKGRRHVCARIWKRSRATAYTPPLDKFVECACCGRMRILACLP